MESFERNKYFDLCRSDHLNSPWDKAAMFDWRGAGVFVQIGGAVCRSCAVVFAAIALSEKTVSIRVWSKIALIQRCCATLPIRKSVLGGRTVVVLNEAP